MNRLFLFYNARICSWQRVILFLSILFIFSGCSTGKKLVAKTHSFFILKQYGTIKVNEQDAGLSSKQDTVIVIYVEATNNNLAWDTAWYNKKLYKVVAQIINNGMYEAGFDKANNKPVTIFVNEKNTLYQLQLQLLNTIEWVPQKNVEFNRPMLRIFYNKKVFLIKANTPVEINAFSPV